MDGEQSLRPLPMYTSSGLSCSLPDDELSERLDLLARVGGSLLERRGEGGQHVLTFRWSPEVGRALERIVAAEKECCSFMDLTIREERDRLVLVVEADGDGALVAAGFAAAFDPSGAAAT